MSTASHCLLPLAVAATLAASAAAQPKAGPPGDRVPVLKPLWKVTTIGRPAAESLDLSVPVDAEPWKVARKRSAESAIDWITKLYTAATAERKTAGRPLIPPFVPRTDRNRVLYNDNEGIAARALGQTAVVDGGYRPGELDWASQFVGSLFPMSRDLGHRTTLTDWVTAHGPATQDVVWSRTLCHAIAVHGGSVLVLDELAFLPPPPKSNGFPPSYGLFHEGIYGRSLRQFDIETGKLCRKVGSADQTPPKIAPGAGPAPKDAPVRGVRFLSVPLPGADGVTFVSEHDRTLRVTHIDWGRHDKTVAGRLGDAKAYTEAMTKGAVWDTELLTAPESVVTDTHRRIHAIHLTEAAGLILCPTHLGYVAALDRTTGKVRWFHEYALITAKRFPTFAPEWVVVPPVVADGKYVYAPADFPELLCLNVADGTKLWGAKKGDGLYPAVVGDKVLVVGEKTLRALSLKDGAEVWKLDLPGLPCGRGAVLGNDYLVPVSEPKTWNGMVAVVDVAAGKVREVLKPEKDEPVGNLVAHQDFLISQTLTELAVYPLKKRE